MSVAGSDAPSLAARLDAAARLAPVGGRGAEPAGGLPARVASRLRYWLAAQLTPRQKQFNLELVGVARELAAEADRLRRELAELRLLVEPVHLRPGTHDSAIFTDVVGGNEYRLPDQFAATDVILDVGCHVGGFAFACLRRGAGRVVGYEAFAPNRAQAAANLARFGGRGEVRGAAVWRSDRPAGTLTFNRSADPANTGGGGVLHAGGEPVPAVPLDGVLEELAGPGGRVRLLKLDCEGSEFPILLTARRLDLVDEVVGEYHEPAPGTPPPADARVDAYPEHDRTALARCLEAAGFRVEFKPYTPGLGAFFARRP